MSRSLEFETSARTFEQVLAAQPNPDEGLRAAVRAAFQALDTDAGDERVWAVKASLEWPLDEVEVSVRATGRIVREGAPDA